MQINYYALPQFSLRFIPDLAAQLHGLEKNGRAIDTGHLADPVIYMLGLGYGLGGMLPEIGGMSYIAFSVSGDGVLQHHEQCQF